MVKNFLVVCGFPGVGKSHFAKAFRDHTSITTDEVLSREHHRNTNDGRVYISDRDNDSSQYLKDNFPENYLNAITSFPNAYDPSIQLVSTQIEVLSGLARSGIPHVVVYPARRLKLEYLQRYADRGSPDGFLRLMITKWDDFISDIEQHVLAHPELVTSIVLTENDFLGSPKVIDTLLVIPEFNDKPVAPPWYKLYKNLLDEQLRLCEIPDFTHMPNPFDDLEFARSICTHKEIYLSAAAQEMMKYPAPKIKWYPEMNSVGISEPVPHRECQPVGTMIFTGFEWHSLEDIDTRYILPANTRVDLFKHISPSQVPFWKKKPIRITKTTVRTLYLWVTTPDKVRRVAIDLSNFITHIENGTIESRYFTDFQYTDYTGIGKPQLSISTVDDIPLVFRVILSITFNHVDNTFVCAADIENFTGKHPDTMSPITCHTDISLGIKRMSITPIGVDVRID